MKAFINLYAVMSVAYGVILGILLIIAICELVSGVSGAAEFRYQGF